MRNRNYDFDDVLDRWDLPVFGRVYDLRKVVYFAPLRILEVIYIFICYYILSIIMYAGCAVVVGMPDHRSQHINKMPDDIVRTTIKVMQMSSIEAFNV
jgi:hypothetical protein